MKPPLRLWIISTGISAGFHVAVLGAVALCVGGPLRTPPRIELPAGEALGVRVILVSLDDAEESQIERAQEVDESYSDPMESIDFAQQIINAQADPTDPIEPDMSVALEQETPSPALSPSDLEMMVRATEPSAPQEVQEISESRLLEQFIDFGRTQLVESVQNVQSMMNRARTFVESANQTMSKLPLPQPPTAAATPTSGGAPGVVHGPVLSHSNKPPRYPEEARRRRQSGTVMLHLEISAEGRVAAVMIIGSSGFEALDHAASSAIESWRFTPATELGAAVACEIDLPVQFILR